MKQLPQINKTIRSFWKYSFLIALLSLFFIGCKKGDRGETGPQGPTGDKGDPGVVGPAGAKGADGTKILSGTAAPTSSQGADGDYFFNTATKTLYGPKAGGAWPAGTSLQGAKGDTGDAGAKGDKGDTGAGGAKGDKGDKGDAGAPGTNFLAGAGAPTAATGKVGDFYFNTTNSTFFGPKTADPVNPWASNQFPLGTAGAARTYYLTRGFESLNPVPNTRVNGQAIRYVWGPVEISSSYFLNADDINRISKYPGWGMNREMVFQSNPVAAPGVFDYVVNSAAKLNVAPAIVGAKFRYTQNFSNPTQEFTLTQQDIDRFLVNGGTTFDYLTYAAVDTRKAIAAYVIGDRLEFHRTKAVEVYNLSDAEADATGQFRIQYQAQTKIDLNAIPGLMEKIESYKQDGKVYLKYRYANPRTGELWYEVGGADAVLGWRDITNYVNSYTKAGAKYGPGGMYTTGDNGGPGNPANPFLTGGGLWWAGGINLGVQPNNYEALPGQEVTSINAAPRAQVMNKGNFVFHWDINSGTNYTLATSAVPMGPLTLVNPNADQNVVKNSLNIPNGTLGSWNYNTTSMARPYWMAHPTSVYYKAPNQLTARVQSPTTGSWSTVVPVAPLYTVNQVKITDGQPPSYFADKPIIQIQVYVIPGDVVMSAKAKGVNVDNPAAMRMFAGTIN